MAKISLNLDTRVIKNGMAQVRIRISHKGTNCFIATGVNVEPQYFIEGSLYDMIHRKAPMAVDKRLRIVEQVQAIEQYMMDVEPAALGQMTANDIRDGVGIWKTRQAKPSVTPIVHAASSGQSKRIQRGQSSSDFLNWLDEFGRGRQAEKTRKGYEYAWNVLHEYCKSLGWMTITFSDINYARLADFGRWLTATKRSPSTRYILESYIRAAYKEAQRCHIVSRADDPYLDYSIKRVPPKDIECLTVEQLRMLQSAQMPCGLSRARDIAMMSFYMCGANLLDLYEMAAPKNGDAEFVRHKLENRYQCKVCIRIEPEMRRLLDVYGGCGALLRFKESHPNYETFQRRVRRQLEEVGERLGFDVSMAMIRRTWATIAGSLEIPDRVIDKSMGHVDCTVKDRHYEKYEWCRTAKANRRVIDYVLKLDADDRRADV